MRTTLGVVGVTKALPDGLSTTPSLLTGFFDVKVGPYQGIRDRSRPVRQFIRTGAGRRGSVLAMSKLSVEVLSELLSVRFEDATLEELIGSYVDVAPRGIPGVDEASVTLLRGERPFTANFTGQRAEVADELQYQRGYGPCLDAGLCGEVLVTQDMREEKRWPDYAAAVVPHGILAAVSIPLPVQTDLIGSLNLYSLTPGMNQESVEGGVELASHIAVAISNAVTYTESAELAAQMQAAMASRAVIEQAKGVIMAQNQCGAERAFEILRVASMGRNVKLRDLSQDIVSRLEGANA